MKEFVSDASMSLIDDQISPSFSQHRTIRLVFRTLVIQAVRKSNDCHGCQALALAPCPVLSIPV